MGLEIERKFLLKNADLVEFLRNEGLVFKRLQVLQFYTSITKNSELRYRSEGGKFIKTTKIGANLIREESESEVGEDEFKAAMKARVGEVIVKSRYLFKLNNNACNIDIFEGSLNGLCTLEIEFLDEKEAVFYNLASEIKKFIARDITCDERYKNKFLAIHGDYETKFDLTLAYDVLTRHDISLNIPLNLNSKDAVCLLFFKILNSINSLRNDYLKEPNERILHKFRVSLRKTRSLLKIFKGALDERVCELFDEKFKALASATNRKRDLDVFWLFLKKQKNADELAFFIEKATQIEQKKIVGVLSNDENIEALSEWELVLCEREGFYGGISANEPIERLLSKRVRAQLVFCQAQARNLSENSSNESFHRLRIELKRLRYALEIDLLRLANLAKFRQQLTSLQELFGELQDRDIWLEILDKLPPSELNMRLKSKIYRQIFKIREQILKRLMKFVRQSRKISRSMKIYYIY